jgi:hypothetical protein
MIRGTMNPLCLLALALALVLAEYRFWVCGRMSPSAEPNPLLPTIHETTSSSTIITMVMKKRTVKGMGMRSGRAAKGTAAALME